MLQSPSEVKEPHATTFPNRNLQCATMAPETTPKLPFILFEQIVTTDGRNLLLLLVGSLGRCHLLLLLDSGRLLVSVLLLSVPLTGLENQNADEDKGQDGVASSQNLETVFPS